MMWLNKLLQFCIIMSFFSKKKLIDLFVHNKPVYSYIHCSQNRTVLCHERAWNKNNKRIKQFTINPIEIHFHTILQRNNISEVKKNDLILSKWRKTINRSINTKAISFGMWFNLLFPQNTYDVIHNIILVKNESSS